MKKINFISLWVLLITSVMCTPFAFAGLVSGPHWNIAGIGDFNGDGCRDILWRNQTTGDMAVWYMHGNILAAEQKFESAPDSTWDIVGVGDFNGDGNPDIVLRNKSTDEARLWYLNGLAVMGRTRSPVWTDLGTLPEWEISTAMEALTFYGEIRRPARPSSGI